MSQKPSISLIIAVYNRADALEMIFTALRRQTLTDFEIVVADDGSGSEIAELIAVWQGRFAYAIRHVWHEDHGFRKTIIINKAVVESTGSYLIFIDGDCLPHRLFLADHYGRKERKVVLAGRRVMLDQKATDRFTNSEIASSHFEEPLQWVFRNEKHTAQYAFRLPFLDPIRNAKRHDFFILGSNFSLFRDDFIGLNGYDERIIGRGMEDNNLHARVLAAGMKIHSISQVALQYHLYHNSKPGPHTAETIRAFCSVEAGWTDFGIKKGKPGE